MTKIAVFVGSLREESVNKNLAHALEAAAPEGVEFDYVDIVMPLYNQDMETAFPAQAQTAKNKVEAADGVLFVTPEYNRSIPGVLKNAIDWTSRPWGKNSFARKPVGIVGATLGSVGTAVAQADLHHIVGFLDMKLLGQPELYMANALEVFDQEGNLIDEHWRDNLKRYMSRLTEWVNSDN